VRQLAVMMCLAFKQCLPGSQMLGLYEL
jgi:hypothetical protein